MAEKNSYYTQTIRSLFAGKDSIIEMAKVLKYDVDRQVCRVFTMTSSQYKDDVPLYFSSLYRNTGIISPPVEGSTSLLLWGPDRQPFLLPIQINTPYAEVDRAVTKLNASPSIIDEVLTLQNIQGGEQLIRSLGGAYLFLKNLGDVEIGTHRLHRISVTEKDGAFDIMTERIRADVGCSKFYVGPASMDSNEDLRVHAYFDLEEFADENSKLNAETDEELVNAVLNDELHLVKITDNPKIYKSQKGHVFDTGGFLEYDDEDRSELFGKEEYEKNGVKHVEQLSKKGRKVLRSEKSDREIEISYTPEEAKITLSRAEQGIKKSTGIHLDRWGGITVMKDDKQYDLLEVLRWFYEDRM